MIVSGRNAFRVLGLTEAATENEVRSAYHRLRSIHHPDKGGKTETFIDIYMAYEKALNIVRHRIGRPLLVRTSMDDLMDIYGKKKESQNSCK